LVYKLFHVIKAWFSALAKTELIKKKAKVDITDLKKDNRIECIGSKKFGH